MKNYDDFTWDNMINRICFIHFCRANNFSVEEATNYIINDYFLPFNDSMTTLNKGLSDSIFKLPFNIESVKKHIDSLPTIKRNSEDLPSTSP